MRLLDEENSPAYLTSSISAVDRYPWICSQTALSPTVAVSLDVAPVFREPADFAAARRRAGV